MPSRQALRTQFTIFVLFGDVILPRGGSIWTSSLLRLLGLLGVSERATRSTLSRMKRKGWLRAERRGRHSQYWLTPKGERLLSEGGRRIFEPRGWSWDGRWCLVVYSIPESKRRLRAALRKRLTFLGFGPLGPGKWISAHDRQAEVQAMLDDLGAGSFVQVFSGENLDSGDGREIVERCWDLRGLNRKYAKFLARWERDYEHSAPARQNGLSPADCFVKTFRISHEYSTFPQADPNLPAELLPEGWLGVRAAELVNSFRANLSEKNDAFIEETMANPNGLGSTREVSR
jgi:phenylacetic acid degradation operon negative regulatory protein